VNSLEVTNYKDETLNSILSVLKPVFNPTKVYLFGSRAKGTASVNSDYDLFLVVKDSDLEPRDRVFKARKLLWKTPGSVDLFIYTEAEFEDWKNEFSSIPHTAYTEGLELDFI
jgi:predicted nucleotidyltransferase